MRQAQYRCISGRCQCALFLFVLIAPLAVLHYTGFFASDSENSRESRSSSAGHNAGPRPNTKADMANITRMEEFNTDLLVYNRVPKCGSIWMTRLLYILGAGDRNEYHVESPYEPGEKPFLTGDEENKVIDHLKEVPKPGVYIRHQYFIDFAEHKQKRPLYINVIRDPVEKFRSFYYFIRNGNLEGDGGDVPMSESKRLMNINDCVSRREKECTEPKWQMVPYFCGQDPRCRQRNSWAVTKAKENIEKYYAAVGLTEELPASLALFETLMPRFFHGAIDVKKEGEERIKNDTYTLNKAALTPETVDFFKTKTSIALEYDLYNFVKARFETQKSKYQIS